MLASPHLDAASAAPVSKHGHVHGSRLWVLALGALGIVYGDIGTSPLYALRECFLGAHALPVTPANVLGILSLLFWALIVVVTIKYHVYVLRMDNHGEGGILALMALVLNALGNRRWQALIVALGLFGAALLYGDGIITPAISVLSAVEGLEVATTFFQPFVVPITIAILIALFLFQRHGTGGIGAVFGPVMLVWFATLAALGIAGITHHPGVLAAFNPAYAVHFFAANGFRGFLVLGGVFLVATGGEALYADMGHFGELPIQIDWFSLVMPSLLLNYLGQGAILLARPEAVSNPFYAMVPANLIYPLVVLATAATVIASQAVISGAFSLTRQAVQLGYCPRVVITHTSEKEMGQIYIPAVNWALMVATIGLVLGFRTSSNLAAAYGIAVALTMVITTALAFVASRRVWHWKLALALTVTGCFLAVDLAFLGANLFKIALGGWLPLLIGAVGYLAMSTWRWGRTVMAAEDARVRLPLDVFLADVARRQPQRVAGTAVVLTASDEGVPRTLLHNFKHNRVLHERVVLLHVVNLPIPEAGAQRLTLADLGQGFSRLEVRYGFMEDPDIPQVLAQARALGLDVEPAQISYFLGRDTLMATRRHGLPMWRQRLFRFMKRNSARNNEFFRLPPNAYLEIGALIEL
jgi:KUP system potassium uptake protein